MKRWTLFTLFVFVMVSAFPAQAAIFQVTTSAELRSALSTAKGNGESDTIRVAQGTYIGNFNYIPQGGENFDLTLEGGWSPDFSTRTLDPTNTILDGNRAGRVLWIDKAYYSNVYVSGNITVEGFTIRNGFVATEGGGINLYAIPPGIVTLNRNIIEENEAGFTGGGFVINNDDSSTKTGGPIHVTNNIIRKNVAASATGGTGGAGRINPANSLVIFNNLIYGNVVGGNPSFFGSGGGLYVSVLGGDVTILNNTIFRNTAYTDAGGIRVGSFGTPGYPPQGVQLSNNIIRENSATTGSGSDIRNEILASAGNTLTIAHNDFHDLSASHLTPTLLNNIDAVPLFVSTAGLDPINWDLRLQGSSPCIDAGDNAALDLPAADLAGNPRVADGDGNGTSTVDMGAYERIGIPSVSFGDLPESHWARSFVLALYNAGITGGCSANPPMFCPESPITRGQMAVFIEASLGHPANTCSGRFTDVPADNPICGFIERMADDGITGGCGNGAFCPDSPVTRAQMAVFIESALGHTSDTCTGRFADILAGDPFCRFIEHLEADGVTSGCAAGQYCPDTPVTRAQMAVFLVAAPAPLDP